MEHVQKTTDEHMLPTPERITNFSVFVQALKAHFMATTRMEDARERLLHSSKADGSVGM